MENHYADAVNRMDMDIAVVLDALKSSKRWDNAVVLIVADHGESLNDHGELLHGDGYSDGVTNVPMVLRVPIHPADQLTSHVDILPTLLEIVTMPPTGIMGHRCSHSSKEDRMTYERLPFPKVVLQPIPLTISRAVLAPP